MKKLILGLTVLTFTACASANSNYIGNGMYEINAKGAPAAGAAKVRRLMYEEAFKACAKDGKGFKLMNSEDTSYTSAMGSSKSNTTAVAASNGYYGVAAVQNQGSSDFNTFRNHGARAIVKCEGPIDEQMAREIASQ